MASKEGLSLPQQSIIAKEAHVRNVAGDYHDSSKTEIKNITVTGNNGIIERLLIEHVAPGALHDSAERGGDAPKCYPETRIAVQKDIMGWIKHGEQDDNPRQILWLSGPAGSGKTAIAGTIADACYEAGLLAASFFFSAFSGSPNRRSMRALVATLVCRLLEHNIITGLKEEILSVLEGDPTVFHRHLGQQFEHLILKPLRKVAGRSDRRCWPIVIVIDGLDECEGSLPHSPDYRPSSTAHKEILSVLAHACADPAFPFRIIIASRPEPAIRHFFTTSPNLALELFLDDKYDPDADIKLFLEAMFSDIRRRFNLPSSWASNDDVERLVREASGQFIYATTVIRFLNDPRHPPQKQLSRLLEWRRLDNSEPFAPLDALYSRILHTGPEPMLAAKWLLLVDDHISQGLPSWYIKTLLESYIGEREHLLGNLSSLVGLVDAEGLPSFQFYHKSLLDFFRDQRRSRDLHVSEEALKRFTGCCYYEVLQGRGPPPKFHLASTIPQLDSFLLIFCVWLKNYMDPRCKYIAEDVQWWLSHLPGDSVSQDIPRMFVSIHQQCRWYECLPACKVWRNGILEHCRAASWRLPTTREMLRDRFEKFEHMYHPVSYMSDQNFPLRPIQTNPVVDSRSPSRSTSC